MRERAQGLGGRLDIAPAADGGTRILVEIPLEQATGVDP
jgi:signal transduction histidine kinase